MDGYFASDSMLRRVQGERVLMISGPRALLMQAADPLAVEGLLAHTTGMDEPYERLERTAEVMSAIGFDSKERADRMTGRVRKMHARVRGTLDHAVGPFPAGTPYAADDPKLLMWVLFTLVDSGIVVYERFVKTHEPRREGGLLGRLPDRRQPLRAGRRRDARRPGGARRLPARALLERRADRHRLGRGGPRSEIVMDPPVPAAARPLLEAANFITIALLPRFIREQYGFSSLPPGPVRELAVGAYAEYVKRGVLPFVPRRLRRIPVARAA